MLINVSHFFGQVYDWTLEAWQPLVETNPINDLGFKFKQLSDAPFQRGRGGGGE